MVTVAHLLLAVLKGGESGRCVAGECAKSVLVAVCSHAHACTLLISSFSPREAFRGPVCVLAIYMCQTEAQR